MTKCESSFEPWPHPNVKGIVVGFTFLSQPCLHRAPLVPLSFAVIWGQFGISLYKRKEEKKRKKSSQGTSAKSPLSKVLGGVVMGLYFKLWSHVT